MADADSSESCGPGGAAGISERCVEWLLKTQHTDAEHVDRCAGRRLGRERSPGAEPNTIATAGALAALAHACSSAWRCNWRRRIERAASLGVAWLLEMQNEDGGWPTYCRDDDAQPFDGSGVDPTAQAVRALARWQRLWKASRRDSRSVPSAVVVRIGPAILRALQYLESQQRDDGSFVPLWFGNEHQSDDREPCHGDGPSACRVCGACTT